MNPHRYSHIERALDILDKSGTIDILKDDHYLLFLFKKTERIVVALYVVTGLFSDSEPLRWSIRESCTEVLRYTLSFREGQGGGSKERLSDALVAMAHLMSLVDIAYVSDLLSPMNFSMIKKELDALHSIIDGKGRGGNAFSYHSFFDEHFFGIPKELFSEVQKEKSAGVPISELVRSSDSEHKRIDTLSAFEKFKHEQKDTHKGHLSAHRGVLYERNGSHARQGQGDGIVSDRPDSQVSSGQVKDERTKQILSILKTKNVAMIKDFSSVINGCSEKTIQRLLIELVQNGVLKREGDRRWSRYSISGK